MKRVLLIAVLLALGTAGAAVPKFEKVPAPALEQLKGTRGKPVSEGLVFVNGTYLKPSYRVARYGTAIFVNDVQVTGQIVPWRQFLATQQGAEADPVPARAEKPSPAAAKADDAADDPFEEGPAVQSDADDRTANRAADGAASANADPVVPFASNERSEKLLKKINDYRLDVQRKLRAGNLCFYGTRYPRVVVEPRIAKELLAVLPEAMRDANDAEGLAAVMRTRGFLFMRAEICEELLENRADYLKLIERRKRMLEDERYRRMIDNSHEERGR